MRRLSKDLNVLDIANRLMIRVAEGLEPTSAQLAGATQIGKTLTAQKAQLFMSVLFSTIEDNQDNPAYEDQLASMFALKTANELEDLSMNGTSDGGTPAVFLALNKGWVQIAKDAANTHKFDTGTLSQNYMGNIKSIVDLQDERFKATSVLVMSSTDYDGLIEEVGGEPGGIAYILQGSIPGYKGREVIKHPFMPIGTIIFTPLMNYVFGICKEINRYREIRGAKRSIDYTFDLAVDFEFAIDAGVVIGYDIP